MRHDKLEQVWGLFLLGLIAVLGGACGSGAAPAPVSSGDTAENRKASTFHKTDGTGAVPLKDRLGNGIAVGSTTPYSPEKTCGGCHDVDVITQGYHFQQGKGTSNTDITVADNYNPAKPWLLSDGMYGKW